MKRLIIFLIRKRLGLRRGELFQFANQKSLDVYYFTTERLIKMEYDQRFDNWGTEVSDVGLNWLLDDKCKIVKVEEE